jgi:hypothetical protein
VAWLLVAVIAIQAFLAGLALANFGGDGDFSLHAGFGYTVVGLVALALVIAAALTRAPRADIALAVGLLLLYFVQTILPEFRNSIPVAAALHPANALLLFALAVWAARRAGRGTRSAEPQLT